MALNSINTNIAAYSAQSNIGKASDMASSSIARLSSGSRIVRAADDVAAMSAGTSLRTNVTTLRMALVNTAQGSSLLQVADGALTQVTDILQRQKAIAVQAGAGSLTSNERSFLNQEFSNLTEEIDRIVGQTNFNGVSLLDGSLSEKVNVADVDAAATSAEARVTFNLNVTGVQTLELNGVAVTAGTDFTLGGTIQETIDNVVTFLNSSSNVDLSSATYSREGNDLVIKSDSGGKQGESYYIDLQAGTYTATDDAVTITGGTATATLNMFTTNVIAATSTTASVTAAASSTTEQFQDGENIVIGIGGAGANVYTTNTGDSLEDITQGINANTSTHGLTARIIGYEGNYNIQLEHSQVNLTATATAEDITITAITNLDATLTESTSTNTVNNEVYSLHNGADLGIGEGDTIAAGSVGDPLIKDQNQTKSSVQLIMPSIADADLVTELTGGTAPMSIEIGIGAGNSVDFFFTEGGTGPLEIKLGATLEETLDNAVSVINSFSGQGLDNYALSQIEARRDGSSIIFETVDVGSAQNIDDTVLNVTLGNAASGSSVTNGGNFDNGKTDGVSVSGITNSAFTGTIQGVTATYTSTANTVDLSVTIGEHTYSSLDVTTNPTADTTVRLSSESGGYFDIDLAANKGETVSSASEADAFATRLNAALDSLSFYQNREVSSYTADKSIFTDGVQTGTLIGTSFELQGTDFSNVKIDSIRVSEPTGSNSNGSVVISVNGEEYTTASNVGSSLGANTSITLVSASDSNKTMTFNTGDVAIDFSTSAKAATFEQALKDAFGVGNGDSDLKFQVGTTTADTLRVGVDNIDTNTLFGGLSLDVLTAENAAIAADEIDKALAIVTGVRAEVGALQSRFDFAAANVESSIQNQDAARGTLLDTDISAESTAFATAQVQLQAGIAVLAQANQLPQNLLKLIG